MFSCLANAGEGVQDLLHATYDITTVNTDRAVAVEGGNKSTSSAILAVGSNLEFLGATASSDSSLALMQRMLDLRMEDIMNKGGFKLMQVSTSVGNVHCALPATELLHL